MTKFTTSDQDFLAHHIAGAMKFEFLRLIPTNVCPSAKTIGPKPKHRRSRAKSSMKAVIETPEIRQPVVASENWLTLPSEIHF